MRFLRHEPLEQRQLLAGDVSVESAEIAYFLIEDNPHVERYDIEGENWLSSVDLPDSYGPATTFHVDEDGMYVAYGKAVYRYNQDGTGQTHLLDSEDPVQAIHSDGNLLFVNHSSGNYGRFLSIDKTTNTILDTYSSYLSSAYGSSIAPEVNHIFGREFGGSPSDISYVTYDDDGNFTDGGDSPYHGDYPDASQTWVFPNGSMVVDDSGTIYSTEGLTRLKNFDSGIDDLDFLGEDLPVVLYDSTLTVYTDTILPTKSRTLSYSPDEIYVNDTHIVAFTADPSMANGFQVDLVPLTELTVPTPGEPVNPVGLSYTPDKIEIAADGTLLLYSKAHQNIFRWDPQTRTYGDSIALIGTADYMAYSAETNTIYLAYNSGLIRKIELSAVEPSEVPFATLVTDPRGLATAGPYVFAVDASGAWFTHYTFTPDGTEIDAVDWNYFSSEYVWSEEQQKMYFFTSTNSPTTIVAEEINADGTTYPYAQPGGIWQKYSSPPQIFGGFSQPIRVSPDGGVAVLGSGALHDGVTLERLPYALANSITDAAWMGDVPYSIRNLNGVSQLQRWGLPTYEQTLAMERPGTAHSLHAIGDNQLLAITISINGIPTFNLLDSDLQLVEDLQPDAAGTYSPATGTFYFPGDDTHDIADEVSIDEVENQTIPLSGDWDGDGTETIGIYNPANATFQLSNSNTLGVRHIPIFHYGIPNWVPLVGDWNGDDIDTIGLYNPDSATFFLRNSNDSGVADSTFNLGMWQWTPLAGDWNGDGVDTVGVYNQQTATFFLRNSNDAGIADVAPFNYGLANWSPLAGDWNGDGIDSIGVYNPDTATFFLRNTNDAAASDLAPFNYGIPGMIPVIGAWNPVAMENQMRELAFATLEFSAESSLTDKHRSIVPSSWNPE